MDTGGAETMRVPFVGVLVASLALAGRSVAAEYVAEVRKDDPIAWWRFQDAAGTEGAVARDETGKHPGVYRRGVRLEAGPLGIAGRAARFDGKQAFVEVLNHADFAADGLSVEVWFQSTQPWQAKQWPGSATLLSKATAGPGSSDWTINAGALQTGKNEGRILTTTGAAGSGLDTNLASGQRLNDGQWHHVVWTRSAAGVNSLYVDGQLVDQAEDESGSIANDRPIQLGGDPCQRGTFLDGALAEPALYAGVLTADRVRAHAVAGGLAVPTAASRDAAEPQPLQSLALQNSAELGWELWRSEGGWSLGRILLHGKPLERPAMAGILALREVQTGNLRWLAAEQAERIDRATARLSGQTKIGDAIFRFHAEVALQNALPAAAWTTEWSVDRDVDGWEVCLAPWDGSDRTWRCWLYPFAGNSAATVIAPLRYCGVPAALVYRPDLSAVVLYGIDPVSDYLNPTTWTGQTSFHFRSRQTAPQFRSGGKLSPAVRYRMPLQLLVSDAGDSAAAVTQLVNGWIQLNRYQVAPLQVRTPDEALAIFVAGRRVNRMWQPGKGYQIQDAWPVIYMPESPINAYLDYLLYEQTGEPLWRERAFEIMDFVKQAQHTDPVDVNFGAIQSHYNLPERVFASTDRGHNPGLKPDMNAFAARYALMLWQRVKQKEGLDRQDWRELGVRIADWVVRQQRPDGGVPQVVGPNAQRNAVSVVSGRVLVALPWVRRITGDARYDAFIARHEQFVRRQAEGRFWFTGAHTDLPPADYEADSVWQVVEYWLDKHEATGDREALARAEADALLAFLMMCPKQLPWVRNPTQTCHAEQQHYLQYSNYCYTNAKIACLYRLARRTGRSLYRDLGDRIVQSGLWCQETAGPWQGAIYERMSDPWLGVSREVDSKGTRYMSELAVDLHLQLIELGLARLDRDRLAPPRQ
jgi:hypothetical protein